MNAGFSSLYELKKFLLTPGQAESSEWDEPILAIGLGSAAMFERYCARKFQRTEGATDEFPGDRSFYVLNRYPIETITAVDLKSSEVDGWESQVVNEIIQVQDNAKGIIDFGAQVASWITRVRVTYTGGYFWSTEEQSTTTTPDGATDIPKDLLMAWKLQCQHIWNKRDNLGFQIVEKEDPAKTFVDLGLIPMVEAILKSYRRYQSV